MRRRRAGDPSRLASLLFGLGCLSVLGLAFMAGVATGRHWPRWLPSLGSPVSRAEQAPARKAADARLDKPRSPEPSPVLTFYDELKAPLTAPPPPPKPKPEKPTPAKARPQTVATATDHAAPKGSTAAAPVAPPKPTGATRYAVQVGAYKDRGPAEAMRSDLATAGWDAYLAEIEGPDVVRYRVRVGSYATREEARAAAQRLSGERRVSTYVTVR